MEIVGIVEWKKHLRKENREIYKTELSVLDRNKIALWSILLSALSVFVLILLKDSSPFIDGITTSLSIIGMYLTVKRCIEQWLVWCVVNFLSIIMWCKLVLCGSRTISTIVMWSVYFLLGIYFYQAWRKELSIQSNQ
jgi:nicotinamide mononucleotide transporter